MKILFICGASGSGKDFLAKELLNDKEYFKDIKFNKTRQVTTRKKRNDEDIWYDFLSKEKYNEIENTLYAKTHFNGNYYGTPFKNFKKGEVNLLIVNYEGYNDFLDKFYNEEDINIKFDKETKFLLLRIENDNLLKRKDRTIETINEEKELLQKLNPEIIIKNNGIDPLNLFNIKKKIKNKLQL